MSLCNFADNFALKVKWENGRIFKIVLTSDHQTFCSKKLITVNKEFLTQRKVINAIINVILILVGCRKSNRDQNINKTVVIFYYKMHLRKHCNMRNPLNK